jgi:hypothetical protein
MSAKCPYCNQALLNIDLTTVPGSALMGTQWKTVIYSCPSCQKALNASIDPIAIKTDIIKALTRNRS